MFNTVIDYLPVEDELTVAMSTTSHDVEPVEQVLTGAQILDFQRLVRKVHVPENVGRYAVDIVRASRPGEPEAPEFVNNWVSWGAGLRAAQYLLLGAKVRAVFNDRYNASIEDVKALAYPVLRHRILTNFYAESEGIKTNDIIARLLDAVREPSSGL
jgi:MoxR-like ATPase